MNRPHGPVAMPSTVALHLAGIVLLCVPIAKQLRKQGLRANPAALATAWQVRAEEIFRMNVKGLLTDAQAKRHRTNLFKEIVANVVAIKRRRAKHTTPGRVPGE